MLPADRSTPRAVAAAVVLIVLAVGACYANSLGGEFVFDDVESIPQNPSIRSLSSAWTPPPGQTVSGRPLLNVSLALNYAIGGLAVGGYHLVNVLLHLATALTLFAVVRGTLQLPRVADTFRSRATGVALAVALLWTVHPLTTEVVSYVVQRCESLAALFTLLTLYGLLRGAVRADEPDRRATAWRPYAGAVVACVLGVLSKETAATAPLVALLYDRAFLAGSFREAFRRRGWVYAGLFSTWLLAGLLAYSTGGRGGTAGFGVGVSPWRYAAAQAGWVLHYLRLSVWPEPLVFDYGTALAPENLATLAAVAVVLVILGLTVAAYVRRPQLGFLPAAFFLLLAPSSSFIPVATQVAAERRMYLPLAAVVTAAVLIAVRLGSALPLSATARRGILVGLLVACVVPLSALTHLRNGDYQTAAALWADTAAKVPDNPRPHTNLGRELLTQGRTDEAVEQLRTAVALAPDDPRPHNLLGFALAAKKDAAGAVDEFREVVRLDPGSTDAALNLATALLAAGQNEEAIDWYGKAVAAQPENADAHFGLGRALLAAGREREAADSFRTAARLDPQYARLLGRPR